MAKHGKAAIGRKIKRIKREGKPQRQAVAQALSQARRGDLGPAAKREAPPRRRKKKK